MHISFFQLVNETTVMQSVTDDVESPPLSKNITDDEKICLPSSTPRDDSHNLAGSIGTSAYGEAVEGVLPTRSPYSKIYYDNYTVTGNFLTTLIHLSLCYGSLYPMYHPGVT